MESLIVLPAPPPVPPVSVVRAAVIRHAHQWDALFTSLGDEPELHVSACVALKGEVQCRLRMVIVDDDPPSVCSYVYRGWRERKRVRVHVMSGGGCTFTPATRSTSSRET